MKTTGEVIGIIANLVTVRTSGPVSQNEICYILMDGGVRLMAEVIKVIGDKAYVQVFESTRGLKGGTRVEFEGHMLEATLGPGILTRIYDGLQNDLKAMEGVFLKRGEYNDPLDYESRWDFTPWQQPKIRKYAPETGSAGYPKGGFSTKSWYRSRWKAPIA